MKKASILVVACMITVLSTTGAAETRHRSSSRRSASAARAAAEKSAAEVQAGRARVSTEIKTLTRFLYLFGAIAKNIESTQPAAGNRDASTNAVEQNERSRAKVRESIRGVREGLEKLEADFRASPALKTYYPYVAGVATIGVAAEDQAAANRFDEAGKSLLKAVDKLADALAATR